MRQFLKWLLNAAHKALYGKSYDTYDRETSIALDNAAEAMSSAAKSIMKDVDPKIGESQVKYMPLAEMIVSLDVSKLSDPIYVNSLDETTLIPFVELANHKQLKGYLVTRFNETIRKAISDKERWNEYSGSLEFIITMLNDINRCRDIVTARREYNAKV